MIGVSLISGMLCVSASLGDMLRCSVDVDSRPIGVSVSRVVSLGKVDDTHELFYLADGDVYLLFDGVTFSVKKDV